MPKRQKHNINQKFVDTMNSLVSEPEARTVFRENLVSYAHVLADPNMKLPTYIDAVRYVSFKLLNYSNQDAWVATFPERHQRLLDDNKDANFLRSTVACYHRNKIVNQIMEQTMVPSWVLNQDMYQKALNTQLALMSSNDVSDKVRTEAANSLLSHLKQPEATKLTLDVNVKQDDSIRELTAATVELARIQKESIEQGLASADSVAKSKIIQGESERLDEDEEI
jgi:hypothetical protein